MEFHDPSVKIMPARFHEQFIGWHNPPVQVVVTEELPHFCLNIVKFLAERQKSKTGEKEKQRNERKER
jgi:hypothetical protein